MKKIIVIAHTLGEVNEKNVQELSDFLRGEGGVNFI